MSDWSPEHYLNFATEREMPAYDLLTRLSVLSKHPINRILDIGCGPGNSTELLVKQFKNAEVIGLDSSQEMIKAARLRLPSTHFITADIASWHPETSFDLFFSNAAFQWIPSHLDVLLRLFEALESGKFFAIQVPDNLSEPSHQLMEKIAHMGSWKDKFTHSISREKIHSPEDYYSRFKPLASSVDIWRTIYHHPFTGSDKIFEMIQSTGLRPYFERLNAKEKGEWISLYKKELAMAYPLLPSGEVLYRFPRLFLVAMRKQ